MNFRRVVAGTREGKSVFLSDGAAPHTYHYQNIPGFVTSLIWQTNEGSTTSQGITEVVDHSSSLLPDVGECKCLMVSFPPDSVFASEAFNPERADAEQRNNLIGLYECFDPQHPGKHATPTIDFGVVIKGPILLEVDDGDIRELSSGDVVVQQGNMHAWRNPGLESASVLFVLVGASS